MNHQKRRLLAAVWLAALIALQTVSVRPAAATIIPDLSISVASLPATVSPGGLVLYEVAVKNVSAIDVEETFFRDINVTNWLPSGFVFDSGNSRGCGFKSNALTNAVSCGGFSLGAGQSKVLHIAATAATDSSREYTDTVSITSSSPPDLLGPAPNTATTTTTVANEGMRYLPPGEHRVGNHVLTVPSEDNDATPGVIGKFSVHGAKSKFCNPDGSTTGRCKFGEAVTADFAPASGFDANNRANPIKLSLNFNKSDPCRGIGGGSGCANLRAEKVVAGKPPTTIDPVPDCAGGPGTIGGPTDPQPCIDELSKTLSGGYHFGVLLLSEDPTFY